MSEAMHLLETLLERIPSSAVLQPPVEGDQVSSFNDGPYLFARTFYGLDNVLEVSRTKPASTIPFITAFEDLVYINTMCCRSRPTANQDAHAVRELIVHSIGLLNNLLSILGSKGVAHVDVDWDPTAWLSVVLEMLESEVWLFKSESLHC